MQERRRSLVNDKKEEIIVMVDRDTMLDLTSVNNNLVKWDCGWVVLCIILSSVVNH